jgi:hypothetical protein
VTDPIKDLAAAAGEESASLTWTAPEDCSTIVLRYKNEEDTIYRDVPGVAIGAFTSKITVSSLKAGLKYWFALVVSGGYHEGMSNEVSVTPLAKATPTPTTAPSVSPTAIPTGTPSTSPTSAPSVSPTSGDASGSGGGGGCSLDGVPFVAVLLLLAPLLVRYPRN